MITRKALVQIATLAVTLPLAVAGVTCAVGYTVLAMGCREMRDGARHVTRKTKDWLHGVD